MREKIFILLFVFSVSSISFAQSYKEWVTKSADYMELNLMDSAEFALKEAIKVDPDNTGNSWLMTSLGTVQQYLGKLDAAYISLTAALNKHPHSVFILHQRAGLLKEMEKWDEAESDYNSILSVDSLDIEALYNRGVLKLEAKDRAGAEKDFEVAELHGEFSPYRSLGKALIYRLDENWEEAEKVYTSVLNAYPEMTHLYIKRAECYLYLDQLSRLSADLRAAAEHEFDNPMYYLLRGRMRLKQFDKFAAKEDFKRAEKLGMDSELLEPWMKKAN